MQTKILMAFIVALFSLKTQAMVFIAPGFDYVVSGSTKQGISLANGAVTGDVLDHSISGYSMSLKVGYSAAGFAFGAVGSRSYVETKAKSAFSSLGRSVDDVTYKWKSKVGAFVGYRLPIMLSFGASYLVPIVDSAYSGPESNNLVFNVGYSILPMIQLTFSYQMPLSAQWYDEGTANDLPYKDGTTTYQDDFTMSTMSVGISVPLGF